MGDETRLSRSGRRRIQDRRARLVLGVICAVLLFSAGLYLGSRAGRVEPALDRTLPEAGEPKDAPAPGEGSTAAEPQEGIDEFAAHAQETLATVSAPSIDLDDMSWPIRGEILKKPDWYFSEILEEWRYRPGVEIKGSKGAQVRSCLPGTVKAIISDPILGTVIVVDHGSETVTRYAGVERPVVSSNQQVAQGDVIAYLKGSALVFEVMELGDYKNPSAYLDTIR